MTRRIHSSIIVVVLVTAILSSIMFSPYPVYASSDMKRNDSSSSSSLVEAIDSAEFLESAEPVNELSPQADPVAPASPEIQYSGDPGGAYVPEPEQAPVGPQTLIVIPVYFSDLMYTESSSTYNSIIFGSVNDFYQEVSYGICFLSGTVTSWYNVGNTKAYYGADGATSGATDDYDDDGDNDSWRLVDDAIAAADPFVDFSSYGHIMVIHAGNGQESSGVTDDIWSVRWSWPGHFVTDEKTFDSCTIVPETQGGDVTRTVGVIAHEFGHDIGLPDLYHSGHTGEDDFVDEWGLMASGNWNGVPSGTSPAHPMVYSKIQLEWITNIMEVPYGSYWGGYIFDQETPNSGNQAIKIIVSSTEYYVVEVRQTVGYDAYLPSAGVLITYCDESLGSGQGIVKVQDAHPETATLDDAAYQSGESFLQNTLHIDIHDFWGDFAYISVMWREEGWIDNLEVSSSTENQYNPDIASDASGNLYVAHEEFYAGWGTQIIRLRMSSDGGRTWTHLMGFGSSSYSSYNPKIVVDSQFYDTVYVVYETEISVTDHDIIGYAYNSTGSYFMYIDTDADDDRYPCITCEFGYGSTNRLYVAYEELFTYDDRDMIVKQSTDKGANWNTVLELGAILDYNVYCDLSLTYTVDSDSYAHVYVAYVYGADYATGYSVGVYHSTNRGASWMHSWAVSGSSHEKHGTSIAAGHTTGTAIVAWQQSFSPTDTDIWIAYSTDNGANWVSQWIAYTGSDETDVDVGVDGQGEADWSIECPYFHVVYRVGTDVLYKRAAANRPNSWSTAEIVNSGGSASLSYKRPAVAGTIREDGSHHPSIVWTEFTTPYAIYYSTRGGTVTVVTEPAGLIIELDSVGFITPFSFERIAGMTADFFADAIQGSGSPGVRYVWDHWSFDVILYNRTSQDLSWAYDPFDVTITAHYNTEYYLTVTSPYGTPSGEGWYLSGTNAYAGLDTSIVPVSADERLVFKNWTDDASGTDYWQSDAITMDGPKNATAVWVTQYQWIGISIGDIEAGGSGWFDEGLTVFFFYSSAPPANSTTRFIFSHWSGDVTGTNMSQSSSIVVTGPILFYAHWTTQYYIIVVTDHSSTPSTGWYNKSLTITVSVADEYDIIDSGSRWRFDSWSGNTTGSSYSASEPILVDGPKTVYANWVLQYLLTVNSAYGTTSGGGWYDSGSNAYAGLNAGVLPGGTGVRYVFLSWAGDASGSNYASSNAITMDSQKTALANWQTQYYLTVVSAHATPSGAGWYASSTLAFAGLDTGTVSGIPGEQFVFQSWSDDASGTDYSWSDAITMDGPKTATAVWQTQYYLTVSSAHGTPSGEGWYASGTTAYAGLDIGVVPVDTGEQIGFQSWSGDASGTDYSLSDTITMDGPKTATAVWQTEYYLTVNSTHGTPSGEGWYSSGAIVYAGLDANIIAGGTGERYVFQSWSDDASGTDYSQSDSITMDGPKTATAVWQTEYYLTVNSTHGTPSGEGWYVTGSNAYAGLDADIVSGITGERFVFQSWSDNASGTDYSQSDAITMDAPKTATAVWKIQYHLTCETEPSELSPAPISTPTGVWFDNGVSVNLEAQEISGYVFDCWEIDGSPHTQGIMSIIVTMNATHTVIACYQASQTPTGTTTTTTPTPTLPPPPIDDFLTIILIAGVAAGGVIVILVLVFMKRRKG